MSTEDVSGSGSTLHDGDGHMSLHICPSPLNGWHWEWTRMWTVHSGWRRRVSVGSSAVCFIAQSCLTLCDPMDCSLPGSSAHGILQARILVWVTKPFCVGSSQPRNQNWVSKSAGRFFTTWATREIFYFCFCFLDLGDKSELYTHTHILLWIMSKKVLPVFSSRNAMVSSLTFRSLIHLGSMYGLETILISFFLHWSCPAFPAPLTEETFYTAYSCFHCQ